MKDVYKNPTLYYMLAPVVAALWSLVVGGIYLPGAERKWQAEKSQYNESQTIMTEILALDPDRIEFADSKTAAAEFDYARVVENIASLCKIPSGDYKLSSRPIVASGGQKSQSAHVALKNVDITQFAKFLSSIQLRWSGLQCVKVKLTKKKGLPDAWDADLEFKYYY